MAGKGLYTYTVQESENIDLGQCGSIFTESTSTAITPPSGHVFIAIQAISPTKFDTSGGLVAENPTMFINSETASSGGGSGTGGEVMGANTLIGGQIIYGRWTSINLLVSQHGIIAYIGK